MRSVRRGRKSAGGLQHERARALAECCDAFRQPGIASHRLRQQHGSSLKPGQIRAKLRITLPIGRRKLKSEPIERDGSLEIAHGDNYSGDSKRSIRTRLPG